MAGKSEKKIIHITAKPKRKEEKIGGFKSQEKKKHLHANRHFCSGLCVMTLGELERRTL